MRELPDTPGALIIVALACAIAGLLFLLAAVITAAAERNTEDR